MSAGAADQDVVERLAVAVEDVAVALGRRQRLDERGQHAAPSALQRRGELEVVQVAERRPRWRSDRRQDSSTKSCTIVACCALDLGAQHRRLKAAEQRLVAALRVEVVGDHEQRLAVEGELAGQRLAAGEGRVGRGDAARAERQLGPPAPSTTRDRGRRVPPGRSTNARPRSVRNRKPTRMLPPGSPPSWSLTGSIWRNWYVGPPAASMAAISMSSVTVASTTASLVAPLLSWISSSATMSGDREVVDDQAGEVVELRGGSPRVEVLDVEGRDGELVRAGGGATPRGGGRRRTRPAGRCDLQLEVAEAVVENADGRAGEAVADVRRRAGRAAGGGR